MTQDRMVGHLMVFVSQLWDHSKGPSGAPEPRITGPILPGSVLSVENHYFGPWVSQSVLGSCASTVRDPHRLVWPGFHPSYPQGSLGATGYQSQAGFLIGFIDTVRRPQERL